MKRGAPVLAAFCALLLCGCPAPSPVPGDVVVGVFDFRTALVEDGCGFLASGLPASFSSTLSLETGSERAFLTIGASSLEGTLTAGELVLEASSLRAIEEPCRCSFKLVERIEARTAGPGGCAPDAGEPPSAASLPDGGLDIRQLCGTIRDELTELSGASCSCAPCAAIWTLSGTRQ